jgi:hypothetical protein
MNPVPIPISCRWTEILLRLGKVAVTLAALILLPRKRESWLAGWLDSSSLAFSRELSWGRESVCACVCVSPQKFPGVDCADLIAAASARAYLARQPVVLDLTTCCTLAVGGRRYLCG